MALEKWENTFLLTKTSIFFGIIDHNGNTLVSFINAQVIIYYAMKMLMSMVIFVESH
ncbi:hypothetical protein QP38_0002 [Levilactobacillus brevis]|nr:hypothetical protein QP38_0002 [Levilactobacillus brevis]